MRTAAASPPEAAPRKAAVPSKDLQCPANELRELFQTHSHHTKVQKSAGYLDFSVCLDFKLSIDAFRLRFPLTDRPLLLKAAFRSYMCVEPTSCPWTRSFKFGSHWQNREEEA